MRTAARSTTKANGAALIGEAPVTLFRMKSDQFCELPPSDLFKLELLNGEVMVMTRPTPPHQRFILLLAMAIESWVKSHRLGKVYPDTLMKLDDDWTPAPDLVFVARKRLRRVKGKRIEGPVDLAIEIISPSHPKIDREVKFKAYAQHGVAWYWIVDLKKRTLEEYQLVEDSYELIVEAPFDKPFKPRLFKGLVIDLASLEW